METVTHGNNKDTLNPSNIAQEIKQSIHVSMHLNWSLYTENSARNVLKHLATETLALGSK